MVQVDLLLVEHSHITGDAHKHILGDVDLHKDQELVQRAKDVTHARKVDPLVTIHAEEMLSLLLILLLVNNEVAGGNGRA